MARIFSIMSGKGGVGKSTLASSLARYFAGRGLRTVLIDGDIGLRCADLMLDVQDRVVFDLGDVKEQLCPTEQALIRPTGAENLFLLAAPQMLRPSDIKAKEISKLIEKLSADHDMILLDAPAGIGRGLKNLLGAESTPIIVATPDDVSLRDAEKTAMLLQEKGEMHPLLVLNRVNRQLIKKGEMLPPAQIAMSLDMPLTGVIEESPAIYRALLQHKCALECGDEKVRQAIENIASRLLGADTPLPEYKLPSRRRFLWFGGVKA